MAALDLGEMADFPFVDPPEERNVADGVRLLEELGAFAPAAAGASAVNTRGDAAVHRRRHGAGGAERRRPQAGRAAGRPAASGG